MSEVRTERRVTRFARAVPFAVDEHPRPDTTVESLARLKPVFRPDGTVTGPYTSS